MTLPPLLLALLPLVAITVILLGARHFASGTAMTLSRGDEARRLAAEADPSHRPGEAVLSSDRCGALVRSRDGGHLAVVHRVGNRFAARYVAAEDVRHFAWGRLSDGTHRLVITLHDVGCPVLTLQLAERDVAPWRDIVERCLHRHPSSPSAP